VNADQIATRLRVAGCVFAEDEAALILETADGPETVETMVARRCAGAPLEVVLGWAELAGVRVVVDAGVFVPRRRSELLATEAVRVGGSVVVDMCCGTGVLGVLLAMRLGAEVHAVDLAPSAVACARRNLPGQHVYVGDLFAPLPARLRGRVDLIIANAPYVPTDQIGLLPPEAREHEPAMALDGGDDGLDVQRRVIAAAPAWLGPGGHLLVETSKRQAPQTADLFARAGFEQRTVTSAVLGATVVVGRSADGSPPPQGQADATGSEQRERR
jgi:release factor glutamine methyltransferase